MRGLHFIPLFSSFFPSREKIAFLVDKSQIYFALANPMGMAIQTVRIDIEDENA